LGYVLGQFVVALAATMAVPFLYGLLSGEEGVGTFLYSMSITAVAGTLAMLVTSKPESELSQREGLLLVVSIWVAVGVFGSLPFQLSGYFPSYTDAFFESISGFTTTGATILSDVEILPGPVQLWRHFSHWIGGMGIVLLGIAILPLVGHGGMQLYRAEFSGAKSERLKPRITETAVSLWKIYVALTAIEFVLLRLAGMSGFDAICHAFSTLGTGGFSTRNASIGAFDSPLIETIIIVFMLLAGISFIQHYRVWVEGSPRSLFEDYEVRFYLLVTVASTAVIAAILIAGSGYSPALGIRNALFQVGSIITTTGFGTDDFEAWHPLPQLILLALMFVGGCTGSTAGGLKASRIVLLASVVDREFKRMVERRGVFAVRLGGRVIDEKTIQSLLNLIYLAFVVNFLACLILASMGVDVLTSISAVAASMFNIGPGLGAVGPTDNYGGLPDIAKWVLAVCMVAGRLEFYTVIVILTPAFWRK
jgi:trk system potassium uptake protein TrkH